MEAFDFLCSVMIRTTSRSEETIKQFGLAAKWFGVKYWEYFNKDATPKVHLLETHVIEEFLKHKRLELFDETPKDRAHYTKYVFTDLFANIKNCFNRQDAIETRKHMAGVPDVQASLQSFEDKSR